MCTFTNGHIYLGLYMYTVCTCVVGSDSLPPLSPHRPNVTGPVTHSTTEEHHTPRNVPATYSTSPLNSQDERQLPSLVHKYELQ